MQKNAMTKKSIKGSDSGSRLGFHGRVASSDSDNDMSNAALKISTSEGHSTSLESATPNFYAAPDGPNDSNYLRILETVVDLAFDPFPLVSHTASSFLEVVGISIRQFFPSKEAPPQRQGWIAANSPPTPGVKHASGSGSMRRGFWFLRLAILSDVVIE